MIRPAVQKDEQELENLCRSVDSTDYVLDHLSTWLQRGEIYVYETDTIIGMVRLTSLRDNTAHLGSVRVHPDHRRQGIATALTTYCISICGSDVVRLAIMDNKPSQAVAQKIGFSPVALFTYLVKPVTDAPVVEVERGTGSVVSGLHNSSLFAQSHFLFSSSFTFYTPSPQQVNDLLILVHDDNVAVLDFDIEEALVPAVQIAYCDCDPELVKAILYVAAQKNLKELWAVVAKDTALVDLLMETGFENVEWGENIQVFELERG
jgi:N-acetylglutamate synthase-like GNAT family acetyltransferase